jgi:hypothetical protein
MTEPDNPVEQMPEVPVQFRGREIYVRYPRPEQLLVWNRTVKSLTEVPVGTDWKAAEVMVALERCRRIIDSIIINKADINWLDDQMLDGEIGFTDLAPFITDTMNAFTALAEKNRAENGTRQEKRAAKPAKKAALKKVAS